MKAVGICLNVKVLAGLTAIGLAVALAAQNLALWALPLLLLAVCPLSMLVLLQSARDAERQQRAAHARLAQAVVGTAAVAPGRAGAPARPHVRQAGSAGQSGAVEQAGCQPAHDGGVLAEAEAVARNAEARRAAEMAAWLEDQARH